jgi:hypothetical protein
MPGQVTQEWSHQLPRKRRHGAGLHAPFDQPRHFASRLLDRNGERQLADVYTLDDVRHVIGTGVDHDRVDAAQYGGVGLMSGRGPVTSVLAHSVSTRSMLATRDGISARTVIQLIT